MQLTINVTQEHIDAGERGSCGHCPVALAMVNAGLDRPLVVTALHGTANGKRVHASMPHCVNKFATSFDRGLPVFPFTFTADFT